jgi:hypothetical protein
MLSTTKCKAEQGKAGNRAMMSDKDAVLAALNLLGVKVRTQESGERVWVWVTNLNDGDEEGGLLLEFKAGQFVGLHARNLSQGVDERWTIQATRI